MRAQFRLSQFLPLSALLTVGISVVACSDGSSSKGECDPFTDPNCDVGITMDKTTDTESGGNETDGIPTTDDGDIFTSNSDGQGSICDEQDFAGEIDPPNVMLVLDKSGSMSKNKWLDQNAIQTRWASLYRTVEFMVVNYQHSIRFGMKLFPAIDATETGKICEVPDGVDVPITDNNEALLLDTMPGANATVAGGTPAGAGLREALEYLQELKASGDTRRSVVILVMDGRVADCDESHQEMLAIAAEGYKLGMPTYVVGIDVDPSTEEGVSLSVELKQLAQAGGTDNYYDSANSELLKQAMEEIIGKISDCRIVLEEKPLQPDWATVTVNGVDYKWLGDTTCEAAALPEDQGGFVYVDVDGKTAVQLCSAACEEYVNAGVVTVNLLCEPPA